MTSPADSRKFLARLPTSPVVPAKQCGPQWAYKGEPLYLFANDVGTLFKSAFDSAITSAVSIFTIKLSFYLTNLVTDALLGVLTSLLPLEIPKQLQQFISSAINFGAEVFFVAVLLGCAWPRTRQQFMRL